MAEKEVVGLSNDPLVKAIARVVERLEASHGPLYAALLAHLPDRPANDWVFLAGSAKLAMRRLDGIRAIVNAMKGVIPREFATRIRRVDVLRSDDAVYVRLSRAFKLTPGAPAELVSCSIFGLEIEHAIVFVMNRSTSSDAKSRRANRQRRRAAKV